MESFPKVKTVQPLQEKKLLVTFQNGIQIFFWICEKHLPKGVKMQLPNMLSFGRMPC
jgi:hypothetical protein